MRLACEPVKVQSRAQVRVWKGALSLPSATIRAAAAAIVAAIVAAALAAVTDATAPIARACRLLPRN